MMDVWLNLKANLYAFLSKLYTILLYYKFFYSSYYHCTQS